jgi:hypothetical protein
MSDFVEKPIKKMLNRQNPDTRLKRVEQRTGARNSAHVQELEELSSTLGDVVGARFIAPTDENGTDITASTFSGSFLAAANELLSDGYFWLANVAEGLTSMGFGPSGIFTRLFADVITQLSDDGTTYRKGRLGMTTLSGRTAPSWGMAYEDNSGGGAELLSNGGFEDGDFTGWTAVSGGDWSVESSGYSPFPTEGTYHARNTSAGEKKQIVDVTEGEILQIMGSLGMTGPGSCNVTVKFYDGTGGSGALVQSYTLIQKITAVREDFVRLLSVPGGAQSIALHISNTSAATTVYDGFSIVVNPAANWFGFEPIDGRLVSLMKDGGDAVGQIPVGAMAVPRVEETKDKLAHTLATGGAVDVGTHYYITTFVDANGETDADLSQALTVAVANTTNDRVALTSIPLGKWGTTARKIWRTKVGGASDNPEDYFLVTTIGDNTTTTYNDDATDASLTDNSLPTVNTTGSRPVWPRCAAMYGDEVKTSQTLDVNFRNLHRYDFEYVTNSTADADGDEYHFGFMLEAGIYTLSHYGVTASNRAKVDYYIDGVLVASGVDWYTAATTVDVTKTASVTVPTSGYHTLTCKINGRNASNTTGWMISLTKIWLTPSAY